MSNSVSYLKAKPNLYMILHPKKKNPSIPALASYWQRDREEHILGPELACSSLSGLLQEDLSYTKWQLITISCTNYKTISLLAME